MAQNTKLLKPKKTILKVENLKKYFSTPGGVVRAVDDVSFELKEGEILGLIGESGSGKTTVGRSLIRLYDDYSGIVTLNDTIISGKKISRENNKFLRRNMQMIFQDPHTSLNGQHNVFSILKEPLIVNGILKDHYKTLFADWKDVTFYFKYSLRSAMIKSELSILHERIPAIKEFQSFWNDELDRIKFDDYDSYEDAFNAITVFYEQKQSLINNSINHIYTNISELEDVYEFYQDKYRSGDLEVDEQLLKDATKNMERVKLLQKISEEKRLLLKETKKAKKLYQDLVTEKRDYSRRSKNIVKNYIYEFKNEYKYYNTNRIKSTDFALYNYNATRMLLVKEVINTLKKSKDSLDYLSIETLEEMINRMVEYNKTMMLRIKPNNHKYDTKAIKQQVLTHWYFNIDKYKKENDQHTREIDRKILRARADYELKRDKANNLKGSDKTSEDYESARLSLAKAKAENDAEVAKFAQTFDEPYNNLVAKLESYKAEFEILVVDEKLLDKKLEEKFKSFLTWISSNPLKWDQFNSKVTPTIFKNRLANRRDTMKAYELEVKVLTKDIDRLKHFFGIKKDIFSKYRVQQVELRRIIYSALEDVGLLRQFAYRYPHEFSGGQRQRIVIARALISEPSVIVADEPIASLDISIQAQVVNLLKDLCKKRNFAMIFIAHDLSMVEYIADTVNIMHLGKIVEEGDTTEIYKKPIHPYTVNLFESIPKLSNADEPFQASNFDLRYLAEQKFPHNPLMHELNDKHRIYGTEVQISRWIRNFMNSHQLNEHKK